MKNDRWDIWLRNWLAKHPLRQPSEQVRGEFRQEVMSRIVKEQRIPALIFRWLPQPRFGFALGTALAAGLLVVFLLGRNPNPPTGQVDSPLPTPSPERFMVAEGLTSGNPREEIVNTLELLELLESNEQNLEGPDRVTDEELMEELRQLDEEELAIS